MNRLIFYGLNLLLTFGSSSISAAELTIETLEETPVLSGGRMKPLSSLAREWVLQITGRREYGNTDPLRWALQLLGKPEAWSKEPMILVSNIEVRTQLGLPEGESRFSAEHLLERSHLGQYAQSLSGARGGQSQPISNTSERDHRREELERVLGRVSLFQKIISGEAWPILPSTNETAWKSLAEGSSTPFEKWDPMRKLFFGVLTAYIQNDERIYTKAIDLMQTELRTQLVANGNSGTQVESIFAHAKVEAWYNRARLIRWASLLYGLGFFLGLFAVWLKRPKLNYGALISTGVGFALHIFAMGVRSYIAGRPPVTNMYESIIWVGFGVVIFSLIIFYLQRKWILVSAGSLLGTLLLLISDAAPAVLDPNIHPLMPVLRSNLWLTVHVLTITISYAAFAVTMGIGNWTLFQSFRIHDKSARKLAYRGLNLLGYRAMQFGVVLLALGTILGAVWADYSWGRFWSWDPKEVWALTALMGYLILLHARLTGKLSEFGFAAWSVLCFALVLMAWYGVNFILGKGRHSYGFSTGGQGYVALALGIQILYIAFAWWNDARRVDRV